MMGKGSENVHLGVGVVGVSGGNVRELVAW